MRSGEAVGEQRGALLARGAQDSAPAFRRREQARATVAGIHVAGEQLELVEARGRRTIADALPALDALIERMDRPGDGR